MYGHLDWRNSKVLFIADLFTLYPNIRSLIAIRRTRAYHPRTVSRAWGLPVETTQVSKVTGTDA